MKLPQGPKTPALLQNIKMAADPLGYMETVAKNYGDVFTLSFIFTPTVFVCHPEGIKQIFTSTKEISAPGKLNQVIAPLVGNNGLLLLDGSRHKHRRKLLLPAFHSNRIRAYGQRISELTQKVISQQPTNQSFSGVAVLQDISLQVILEVVFGLHEGERYEQFKQLLPELLDFSMSPSVQFPLSLPFLRWNLGQWSPWGYFLHLMRQFDQLVYAEINERRQQADSSGNDILSELVSARDEVGEPMTDQELRDLLPSFLFAGQDAAATAIAWSLYWTHHLPAVRDQLLAELDSLGDFPDPMSIAQLPYLSAVCHETLRIYPTQVVTFPRMVESPINLMGYELSPGTVLIGNIYLTHQREDLYLEPKQFKPERFLNRQFSNYEFLPFGGGDRRCPGDALALFEMKLVLATILLNYQLALADKRLERPMRRGVTFPPAGGLKMVMIGQRQRQPQQLITSSV